MAEICPVCEKEITFIKPFSSTQEQGISMHFKCYPFFIENPELYGGKAIEKTEAQIIAEKLNKEQQQKKEDKSVYVKGFNMPFGEMVMFMVKSALASIPAFIILAIIGAIFFAIFGALFF